MRRCALAKQDSVAREPKLVEREFILVDTVVGESVRSIARFWTNEFEERRTAQPYRYVALSLPSHSRRTSVRSTPLEGWLVFRVLLGGGELDAVVVKIVLMPPGMPVVVVVAMVVAMVTVTVVVVVFVVVERDGVGIVVIVDDCDGEEE